MNTSNRNEIKNSSLKWKLLVGGIFISLCLRLCLPYAGRYYVNHQLNKDPAYRGSVDQIGIHLWRGAYTAKALKIEKADGQKTYPFLAAQEIHIGVSWQELFKGKIATKLAVNDFEVNIVQEETKKDGKKEKKVNVGDQSKQENKEEAQGWQKVFKSLVPINVGKLELTSGTIHYRDLASDPKVDIYLDNVEIKGENLTNSARADKNLYGKVAMKARMMKSGKLEIDLCVDPLSTPVEFKLTCKLADLDLVNLNPFFTAYGKFDVKRGQFQLYSEMASADKKIEGYFKPIIKNLQVSEFEKDREKGLGHAVWQKIVAAVGSIFKNHEKNQQAAKIPFSGKYDDFNFDLIQTFTSILENLLIKPILPNLENTVSLDDLKKEKKGSK